MNNLLYSVVRPGTESGSLRIFIRTLRIQRRDADQQALATHHTRVRARREGTLAADPPTLAVYPRPGFAARGQRFQQLRLLIEQRRIADGLARTPGSED